MLEKMRWFAQAIAQPVAIQIQLFPGFVEVADELALGWEDALGELPSAQARLSPGQLQAIKRLDEHMDAISGEKQAHVWTLDGLNASEEWRVLRLLAAELLEQMNWPNTSPPDTQDVYIRKTGELW